MKRLLSIIAMCILIAPTYGQLTVKSEGSAKLIFKSQYMSIQKMNDTYDMIVNDLEHTGTMTIHLGDNLDQALTTYRQICDWFTSAENKSSLVIQGKDGDLTLYKHGSSTWVVTEGDAEYARKFISDKKWEALAGAGKSKRDIVESSMVGYIIPSHFTDEKIQKIFYSE